MQLRTPPTPTPAPPASSALATAVQLLTLVAVVTVGIMLATGQWARGGATRDHEHAREMASKLKAAGAVDEAARLYAQYVTNAEAPRQERAAVAYSLGQLHLLSGRAEQALRWFYEAEQLDDGDLREAIGEKVVHTLERLGRVHAAQAALASRATMGAAAVPPGSSDPVVARIGKDSIRRSDVLNALDELPPQLRQQFQGEQKRSEFVKRYVADELIWRKAQKLEYDNDAEVQRQLASMLKQLAIGRFIEQEVMAGISLEEADLKTFHQANKTRYDQPAASKLSIIELPTEAAAKRAARKAAAGGSSGFAALAKQDSTHQATRAAGGKMGRWVRDGESFLGAGDMEAVTAAIGALSKGKVSDAVAFAGKFYVLRVDDKRAAVAKDFADVRQAVERDYRQMKASSAYQGLIEEQLAAADVQIFADKMGAAN